MVIGIGTDIVEVGRIRDLSAAAVKRVLTEGEEEYCQRYNPSHERIAGRFAAKEAIFKALGTGWGQGVGWSQIEILPDELGAPVVTLTGAARERMLALGASRCLLSISHQSEYAVAFALLT